jgi:CRISPR system Cascade subunit CasB
MTATTPTKPQTRGKKCADWWRSLQRSKEDGSPNHQPDPGALARLRRAATPLVAAEEFQTMRLYHRLFDAGDWEKKLEAVAVVAAVLADVRKNERKLAKGIANAPTASLLGGKEPVMSALRLRSLMSAGTPLDTLRGFRQVVALLGGRAPIDDLAESILDWLDPAKADLRKTRWLFAYFGEAAAAPDDTADDPDADDDATSSPSE